MHGFLIALVVGIVIVSVFLCFDFQLQYPRSLTGEVHFQLKQQHPIDALLPWVDTRDPAWKAKKRKHQGLLPTPNLHDDQRLPKSSWAHFEVMQCVPLLLKNMPFLRHLVVVVMRPQQLPQDLLNKLPPEHRAKIRYVYHDEYIPSEYLPTFNSSVIEMFMHRISSLSEHFILFNDDFYVLRLVKPHHFFGNITTAHKKTQYVPIMSGLKTHWGHRVLLAGWAAHHLDKWSSAAMHAASRFYTESVYRRARPHRKKVILYDRDHRPLGLTKSMLRQAFGELPPDVTKKTANQKFRSSDGLLLVVYAIHVAIDNNAIVLWPGYTSLCANFERQLSITSTLGAQFLNVNNADMGIQRNRERLLKLLY